MCYVIYNNCNISLKYLFLDYNIISCLKLLLINNQGVCLFFMHYLSIYNFIKLIQYISYTLNIIDLNIW